MHGVLAGLASADWACSLEGAAAGRRGRRLAVTGYETAGWIRLFAPAGGASAGLAGLIFVGLSVNMSSVLEFDKKHGPNLLIGRAIEALVGLLSLLVIFIVGLTPSILRWVLAAFILLVAAASAVSPVLALRSYSREERRRLVVVQRMTFALAFSCCLLACGATLAAGHGGGLFWLPAAFVIAVGQASVNAWVLLVEVQRGIPGRATPERKIAGATIRPRTARNHRGTAAGGRAR